MHGTEKWKLDSDERPESNPAFKLIVGLQNQRSSDRGHAFV